jgi:inorganic triphosphatase YgiF
MAVELELKFASSSGRVPGSEELQAALAPLGLEVGEVSKTFIKDRYFDDPRANLTRAGLAVRRRMADGRMLATLKTRGHLQGGLYQREEIEEPLPDRGWPKAIHDRVSLVTDPASLKPYTVLDNERTVVPVLQDGRLRATLSFDSVTASLQSGGSKHHFAEVEVEAAGPVDDPQEAAGLLERIGLALQGIMPLRAGTLTKLERAQALLRGETPE